MRCAAISLGIVPRRTATTLGIGPEERQRGRQRRERTEADSSAAREPTPWGQYHRDLAEYGANAVELFPPRAEDGGEGPSIPAPPVARQRRRGKVRTIGVV